MNPKDTRKKLGLTQAEFWPPIGVTQSGGSRYENGREMPEYVSVLVKFYWEDGDALITIRKRKPITLREYIKKTMKEMKKERLWENFLNLGENHEQIYT